MIGDREKQKSQVLVKGGGVILLLRSIKKEVTCLLLGYFQDYLIYIYF